MHRKRIITFKGGTLVIIEFLFQIIYAMYNTITELYVLNHTERIYRVNCIRNFLQDDIFQVVEKILNSSLSLV